MRRKPGTFLPLELSIMGVLLELKLREQGEAHGFAIAKELLDRDGAKLLIAHGTLYKALDRMERSGVLESRWEDPEVAARAGRPRRRFYSLTATGEAALVEADSADEPRALRRESPGRAQSQGSTTA